MKEHILMCPVCKDIICYTGVDGREYAKPCKCTAIKASKKRLEKSGLAKLFLTKTFESYKTYGNPLLEDAKKTAMHYTEAFAEKTKSDSEYNSLLLCGQVGAGKTHLGTACCVRLIDRGIPVIYMGYREEMTSLKVFVKDSCKPLRTQYAKIILTCFDKIDHRICLDYAIIIRIHAQMKIQVLRGDRHLQKPRAFYDCLGEHSSFCHFLKSFLIEKMYWPVLI